MSYSAGSLDADALGEELPTGIYTPSRLRSMLDQTNTEIDALARDAVAGAKAGRVTPAQLRSLNEFVKEWKRYFASGPSLYWGATGSRVQEYRRRALDWFKQLRGAGVPTSTPEPTVDAPRGIPWWLWAVAGGALVFALARPIVKVEAPAPAAAA